VKNFAASFFLFYMSQMALFAQGLEGRISDTIYKLVLILNLLLVGVIAWNGFMLFTGEQAAVRRLMFTIAGLIVVNSSRLIIDFFI
jgi:hypothetical protein